MKQLYFLLINKKIELAKLLFCILLIAGYPVLSDILVRGLHDKYGGENMLYISSILNIAIFIIVIAIVSMKFNMFLRKNWESLILLTVASSVSILLFFMTNYEWLFIQLYFEIMICRMQENHSLLLIASHSANALLAFFLGIWLGLRLHSAHSGKIFLPAFLVAALLGILIGRDKITYAAAYQWVLSDAAQHILFSDSILLVLMKLLFMACMLFVIYKRYNKAEADGMSRFTSLHKSNIIGDFIHKFSGFSLYGKNYFRIYRNKEFVFWKIFSTLFLLIVCYIGNSNIAAYILSYGVCLITSFYFYDIYGMARNNFLIYFMSTYSYKQLMLDLIIDGIFIVGDNVLLVLLFHCVHNPAGVLVLILTMISVLVLTFFMNSCLFEKYPSEKFQLSVFFILIKLHLPIVNVCILYRCVKTGKANWENMMYENKY